MSEVLNQWLAILAPLDASGALAAPPSGWQPPTPSVQSLPAGFLTAPDANGLVQLAQVETDRAAALESGDTNYMAWANSIPKLWAIDDTLHAFKLTDQQKTALGQFISNANVLLGLRGCADWDFHNELGGTAGSFSNGGFMPETRGVHLRNLETALERQRAHAKAVDMGGSGNAPWVATPAGQR